MREKLIELFKTWWPKKYARLLAIAAGALLLAVFLGYLLIVAGGSMIVDEADLILDAATTIETEDGKVIKELYEKDRRPVKISALPDYIPNAFIAIEDRRFREHGGIDVRSLGRAVVKDIAAGGKKEGASTMTQQVIKNLVLSHEKTWMRKTKEVMAAIYLERHYTKDEILELYLNAVYFGEGVYGIERAANVYFAKHAAELSIDEAALLAGLVKSPAGYSPLKHPDKALERRNLVLEAMGNAGFLPVKDELREKRKTLGIEQEAWEQHAWTDSYTDIVMKEAAQKYRMSIEELKRGGYRIVVAMDEAAQRTAYQAIQKGRYFPESAAGAEGAFALIRVQTGEIAAVAGGRQYKLGDLNRAAVRRQPGSLFKPLAVYGPALMKKYEPYSLLVDQKLDYDGYTARNYDGRYQGKMSMYSAIMQSANAPAVWLLDQIGVPYAKQYLDKMKLTVPDDGLAIALGGLQEGVTPLQIAAAYGTFARNGTFTEAHAIKKIYDADGKLAVQAKTAEAEVFSPQAAWDMTEMLKATVEKGTAKAGTYGKELAGKTGTTQHPQAAGEVKDAWFAGYTPDYALALWMGYDKSDKDHYLEGGSMYPTMLAKDILTELDKEEDLTASFAKPQGVKALPKPIDMPVVDRLEAEFAFGGRSLIRGKLTWHAKPQDKRVIYRIYEKKDGRDKQVGEVKGKTVYYLDEADLFDTRYYYVVPYDPLTKLEGERSQQAELSF